MLVIGEYAQFREFASDPVGVALRVVLLDGQQHAQSAPDAGRVVLGFDRDRRLHHTLNDRNHRLVPIGYWFYASNAIAALETIASPFSSYACR